MRKYKLISALAEETAKEVVRNEENWRRYLNTASRLYKYPFKEQLLIYAQRPEATACASIEIWNEKMHCWVNKGAKGIALIDEDSFSGLKYVFDISDVHKARRIGQFPNLWEMREEHMESVISRLEKTYGDTDREAGFVGRIREIAGRIAEDCYKELASDMEYLKEGSFLEELDELNVEIRIRETLADSIAYTVLKRCGMEESELAEEINFPYIHEFNTVETLSQLGSNVSDLSKPILMEIGKAIGAYDRQIAQNREETRVGRERIDTHEKNIEKGLANASEADYNALKRESEPMVAMDEQPKEVLTKYGLMRKKFLQEHKNGVYTGLLLSGKLKEHLLMIQKQAEERMELLTRQMKEREGITEQMKAENQMLWVAKMNSIVHSAEEIVMTELIYS